MRILVPDISVVIDLDRGSLLDPMFALPFEYSVPDLLFHRELRDGFGDRLLRLGLRIEELNPQEVARAQSIRRQFPRLSTSIAFGYAIAEARAWPLLSGDDDLRGVCNAATIDCRDVLWVFDQFEATRVVEVDRLYAGLTAIARQPRCRLPPTDVRHRLARLRGGLRD